MLVSIDGSASASLLILSSSLLTVKYKQSHYFVCGLVWPPLAGSTPCPERVRRDGKEAGTFVDTMPGYHGGEGSDGSVILPFCDGRYRCLICENGIGHNGMGYTDAQHVPCSDRPLHMGVWGCQLGMQSRYGNPCGAGTSPGICTDTEVMYNHYAWSRRYPVGPDGVFPVGRSHIGLHPAMLTIPELARKVRPEDLVVAASNVSKCIPVARYTVETFTVTHVRHHRHHRC